MSAESAEKERKAFVSLLHAHAKHSWRPNYICEVNSVDTDSRTCDVTAFSGENWPDARLTSIIPDTGNTDNYIWFTPTVGSYVLIELVEGIDTQAHVVAYSSIDQIDILIGQSKFQMKDGKFTFNDGNNNGMVLMTPALNALNSIENDINNLKTAFSGLLNTVINTATPGAPDLWQAAMKAGLLSWATSSLPVTQQSDIENTAIKQ